METTYNIYISSTFTELAEHRKAVEKALSGSPDFPVRVIETNRAAEMAVIDTCLSDVAKCDIYLGIIGLVYGTKARDDKSITELEYDKAVSENRPRLIFIKKDREGILDQIDESAAETKLGRQKAFRDKLTSMEAQQTCKPFDDVGDLKVAVLRSVFDFYLRREKQQIALMNPASSRQAGISRKCVLVCLSGNSHPLPASLAQVSGADIETRYLDIDTETNAIASRFEDLLRNAHAGALFVDAAAFGRFSGQAGLASWLLKIAARRTGKSFLVRTEGDHWQLPDTWMSDGVSVVNADGTPEEVSQQILRQIGSPANAIAVPYSVLALTRNEAEDLRDHTEAKLKEHGGKILAASLKEEIKRLLENLDDKETDWPSRFFGDSRVDWKPFNEIQATSVKTIRELINTVIEDIHLAQQKPGRERKALAEICLKPAYVDLDEYLNEDPYGSRANMLAIFRRGGLLFVDEFALFHPLLRPPLDALLQMDSSAAVTICPLDPLKTRTWELLEDSPHLQVGEVLARFKKNDPLCEISLNSEWRFKRWLRLALLELAIIGNSPTPKSSNIDSVQKRMQSS